MDSPAHYITWGFIHLSIPNVAIIGAMVVIFVAALFTPFPHGSERSEQ